MPEGHYARKRECCAKSSGMTSVCVCVCVCVYIYVCVFVCLCVPVGYVIPPFLLKIFLLSVLFSALLQ